MIGTLEKKSNMEMVPIRLPRKRRFTLMSHLDNINYCIDQIERHSADSKKTFVVGYVLARSLGTIEIDHIILPEELVEERKKSNQNFRYFTLEDLLKEKEAYEKGRYKVDEDGYFVGVF